MSLPSYAEKQLRTPTHQKTTFDDVLSTPDHTNAQLQREMAVQHDDYEEESEQELEPQEEFAPNAAAEEVRPKPINRRKRHNPTRPPKGIFGFIIVSLLSAFFFWWRREKVAVGYCGVGGYGTGNRLISLWTLTNIFQMVQPAPSLLVTSTFPVASLAHPTPFANQTLKPTVKTTTLLFPTNTPSSVSFPLLQPANPTL